MKSIRIIFVALASLAVAALVSGCVNYRVVNVVDHHAQGTTQLETMKTTDYLFAATVEHQFWLCDDKGTELVCERRCGEGTDLQCPAAAGTGIGITTNVR